MASQALIEGRTGTLPDGTRVIVRGGKLTTLDESGAPTQAPVMVDTKTDQDAISAQRDRAATALSTAQQGERFLELNKKVATGPGTQIKMLPFVGPTAGGVFNAANPAWGEMQSISASVAPGLRPPGSGSSSDKDTKLYMQSFPGVGNLGTANQGIAKRLQTTSNQESAKSAFFQTWYQKRGSLLGADQAFTKWWSEKGAGIYDMTRPGATGIANRRPAPPKPSGGYKILSEE